MSIISVTGARYTALAHAYGITDGVPALNIGSGNSAAGATTITLVTGTTETEGGERFTPVAGTTLPSTTQAYPPAPTPITVGIGANAETVTPTSVSYANLGQFGPGLNSVTISATFANVHGPSEPVTSGTFGLQEAINRASANGGGTVVVTPAWYLAGGTTTIIQAAVLPVNGTVQIEDRLSGGVWGNKAGSISLLAAPSTPTSATVASTSATGTWTAVTTYVKFAYVTANGGITLASSEYSFTATVSKAIGGTGPAAATGAVGYLVYIGTTTNVNYQVTVNTTNGVPITCGGVSCFAIGTSFTVAAITTVATPLPPVTGSAFATTVPALSYSANMMQPFQASYSAFANVTTVTAGTASELARVDLPAAFLNQIGRKLRITAIVSFTPGSTATLIPSLLLESVYGTTTTTLSTITTAATSGTTQANLWLEFIIQTLSTGTAGTFESHVRLTYQSATGSAPAALTAIDSVTAATSAANLVTQDQLSLQMNSGTANLTSVRVRDLTIEVLV